MNKTYEILTIGAGINGLATCYHLSKLGIQNIGLIERFDHGHDRASSHGQSRITRSAYINEHYVRLMQVAHNEAWPQLEKDAELWDATRRFGVLFEEMFVRWLDETIERVEKW